jgi:hypothetical protein
MTDIAERLRTPQANDEDVLAYLHERSTYIVEAGGIAMSVKQYWQPADLDRYRMCAAIWAKDAPPRFALPDLPTMLNGIAGPAGGMQTTFEQDLTALWYRYAEWMQAEGRDPYNPEESARQRTARRARESMARTRERRGGKDPVKVALLEEAKRLHDDYLAACRRRKEALVVLDEDVRCAWDAYEQARDAAKG